MALRRSRPGFADVAVGTGLGFALWGLAYYGALEAIGNVRLASTGDEDEFASPAFAVYDLSFHVGDTEIYYGQTLAALIATTILAIAGLVAVRGLRRRGASASCPHCLSAIPAGAAVCAHCTRDVGVTG